MMATTVFPPEKYKTSLLLEGIYVMIMYNSGKNLTGRYVTPEHYVCLGKGTLRLGG